jgi:phage tail-like protein
LSKLSSDTPNAFTPSSYVQYLPGIYQQDIEEAAFIGRFLKIFERLLSGVDDEETINDNRVEGIAQILDRVHEFFDPARTPSEFLKWLAGWMALILREDWEEVKKRRLISRIISLYRIRGTKKGLEEYIKIYVAEGGVELTEILTPFQIGVTSTVEKNTYLDGGAPHFFLVSVILPEPDLQLKFRREKTVRAIIDLEKPAHTFYQLKTIVPTLQIGKFSTIDKDTLLGDIPE